jgi:hypothetical protein
MSYSGFRAYNYYLLSYYDSCEVFFILKRHVETNGETPPINIRYARLKMQFTSAHIIMCAIILTCDTIIIRLFFPRFIF